MKMKNNKDKESKAFYKKMIANQKVHNKLIKPRISYDKKYDIFYMWFGGQHKVAHTIEVSNDVRFDVNKEGNLLSVEIEGFSSYLKNKEKKI